MRSCGHEIFWKPKDVSSSALFRFVIIARNHIYTYRHCLHIQSKKTKTIELKNDLQTIPKHYLVQGI